MKRTVLAVVLACGACTGAFSTDGGAMADAAFTTLLVGTWQEPDPTAHILTFTVDGHARETTAAGQLVSESLYTLHDDQLVLIAVAGLCAVNSGEKQAIYRVTLGASTLGFTLLSDFCTTRLRLDGETWTRLAPDAGL